MKWKIFLFISILAMPFGIISAYGENRGFEISNSSQPAEQKQLLILDKIDQEDDALEDVELKVGSKDIVYTEKRITRNGTRVSVATKKIKEPEKEIALKLLDLKTGEIKIIKITKKGSDLISPLGYNIEIVERSNGIRWNKWNTQYKIIEPENLIVLKNKYPDIKIQTVKILVKDKIGRKKITYGKQKTIEEFIYSPYSDGLRTPEIVKVGPAHIKSAVKNSFNELRKRGVKSRAFPDKLIADVEILEPSFFEKIPLLEQTDLGEFLQDPQKTTERVLVLIGTNKFNAFSKTCSKATACGWVQLTDNKSAKRPGTYTTIIRAYPEAKLINDFEIGAADHINSMMAAILLCDYNLANFIKKYGNQILKDPRLKEYLAASYNGGPARASNSLKASISSGLDEWTGRLKPETKGFMVKYRFLEENNLP